MKLLIGLSILITNVSAFTLTLPSGGDRGSVYEKRLELVTNPTVRVVRDKNLVKSCKLIGEIKHTRKREFWEDEADVCEKILSKLKKMTWIEGGDTLLFMVDHRGCSKGSMVFAYRCGNPLEDSVTCYSVARSISR